MSAGLTEGKEYRCRRRGRYDLGHQHLCTTSERLSTLTTNSEVTHVIGEQGGAFFHLEPHAVQDQLPIRGVPVLEVFLFLCPQEPPSLTVRGKLKLLMNSGPLLRDRVMSKIKQNKTKKPNVHIFHCNTT